VRARPARVAGLALLALLVGAEAPISAEGTPPPAAEGALRRAVARYTPGVAHAASFVQIYTPAGFASARRESGTVWIQAPQRLRFDYAEPEKKTFTYDSGEGRFYSPADKQLTVKKLAPEERARLPIVFLTDPAELSGQYAISLEPGTGGAEQLELRPRAPRPELAWLRLTIAADGSIRGLSYETEGGDRTEFQFDGWHAEKLRPEADYRVVGPKGTRVME
jgi:outer membrane lipoprotein-sorting protein